MMRLHPNLDALLALRDGEPIPPGVEEHLRECGSCRRRLLEARLLRLLVKTSREVSPVVMDATRRVAGPHLDELTLAAYHDQTLPQRQIAKVEAHLLGCERCLEDLLALRADLADSTPEPVPASAFHAAVRALLAEQTSGRPLIGGLALLLRGGRMQQRYVAVPETALPRGRMEPLLHLARARLREVWHAAAGRLAAAPAAYPPEAGVLSESIASPETQAPLPPSSRIERPRRSRRERAHREAPALARSGDVAEGARVALEPSPAAEGRVAGLAVFRAQLEEALRQAADLEPQAGLAWQARADLALRTLESSPAAAGEGWEKALVPRHDSWAASTEAWGPTSSEPIAADIGALHLEFTPEPEAPSARLRVRVADRVTGAPEGGQRLRLAGPGPDAVTTETDEQGEALFLLPAGLARLSLEEAPEAEILVLVVPDAEGV